MAVNALGFLDSICITVFMSPCDIVGISDRLADHDSLSTQRYCQSKRLSRVVPLSNIPTISYSDINTVIHIESRNPKLFTAECKNVLLAHILTGFRR